MDKVYETFGISEKEYKEYRNCLDTDRYFVDTDKDMCRILYLDGDDGVALFNTLSESFGDDGVKMELIDCSYCDVSLEYMSEIVEILNKFKREHENE